jgi:hypothetical protein
MKLTVRNRPIPNRLKPNIKARLLFPWWMSTFPPPMSSFKVMGVSTTTRFNSCLVATTGDGSNSRIGCKQKLILKNSKIILCKEKLYI